jgi:GAF domain-containing protein
VLQSRVRRGVVWEDDDEIIEVAQAFDRVARELLESRAMGATLDHIVNLAVKTLDACEFAGISLVQGKQITSPASSNDVPRIVDALQSETGEGPCIDAIREHEMFRTGHLDRETRWPNFATRAHDETGVTSILSHRLFAERDTMGALNLYSTQPDAFSATDVALGAVFATHAAVAMSAAKRDRQYQHGADNRDIIGQAKGIIMASTRCSADAAFGLLVRQSQHENRKLVDIASELADRAGRKRTPDQPL